MILRFNIEIISIRQNIVCYILIMNFFIFNVHTKHSVRFMECNSAFVIYIFKSDTFIITNIDIVIKKDTCLCTTIKCSITPVQKSLY